MSVSLCATVVPVLVRLMVPASVSCADLLPSISPCVENGWISRESAEGSNFGNRRESNGFSELSEAQVIAVLISMQDQFAMPMLFQVGSGVVAASMRTGIRKIEIMQTLWKDTGQQRFDAWRE